MKCSQCGSEVNEEDAFCMECGQPVHSDASADDPVANVVASTESSPVKPVATEVAKALPFSLGNRTTILICVAVAVVALAIIACIFLFARPGSSSTAPGEEAVPAEVVGRSGEAIKPLSRPKLVDLKTKPAAGSSGNATGTRTAQSANSVQTMVSPALAPYVAQASAESGSESSSTQDGNGGASEEATSTPAAPADPALEAEAPEELMENPYGDVESYAIDPGLDNVVNKDDYEYMASEIRQSLADDLFVVNANSTYNEYFDLYESNRYSLTPNFITVDSIMHTYHLYFAHLLKNTESNYLFDRLEAVSEYMLNESLVQYEELADTEWADAAKRNMVFFGVAWKLLDPAAVIPDVVAQDVTAEVARIEAASEPGALNTVTAEPEDYTQYKVRGYYEETDRLSRYFRAMMWYGRTHFLQTSLSEGVEDKSVLNRCALLMTLAMEKDGGDAANADWETIYAVTSFFAGASDDSGFYEYLPLVQAAYGDDVTAASLPGNEEAWEYFNELTAELDPPQISSVIVGDEESVDDGDIKGFRFMGQRFSIDESIFQQLTHDDVLQRMLPSAMDLPAALGSTAAVEILDGEGKTDYANYSEQLEKVREDVASSDLDIWSESLYSSWLYTLCPLLLEKGEGYPTFMVSEEWDKKDLQTFLASYTELKHDTVLYSKQVMAEMGGGYIDKDDRGYVEPETEVYARLTSLIQATSEGLKGFGILDAQDGANLGILEELASQLEIISTKELKGEMLTDDEYELIRSYGGQLEHFWDVVNPDAVDGLTKSMVSPAAVVVDIATDGNSGEVLEVATGKIAEILVVAPVAGQLKICSGGVPLYYEFTQPQTDRLTDSQWREMLGISSYSATTRAPDPAEWTESYTVG